MTINIDMSDYKITLGVSFSLDNRYLYMANRIYLYQYDLGDDDPLYGRG